MMDDLRDVLLDIIAMLGLFGLGRWGDVMFPGQPYDEYAAGVLGLIILLDFFQKGTTSLTKGLKNPFSGLGAKRPQIKMPGSKPPSAPTQSKRPGVQSPIGVPPRATPAYRPPQPGGSQKSKSGSRPQPPQYPGIPPGYGQDDDDGAPF